MPNISLRREKCRIYLKNNFQLDFRLACLSIQQNIFLVRFMELFPPVATFYWEPSLYENLPLCPSFSKISPFCLGSPSVHKGQANTQSRNMECSKGSLFVFSFLRDSLIHNFGRVISYVFIFSSLWSGIKEI